MHDGACSESAGNRQAGLRRGDRATITKPTHEHEVDHERDYDHDHDDDDDYDYDYDHYDHGGVVGRMGSATRPAP